MAKKKNNRKKVVKQQPLSPKSYIKKKARKLPVERCIINDNWKDSGIATVLIARKMRSGNLIVGSYIVDILCLGLKNTHHWFDVSLSDFEGSILDLFKNEMDLNMIDCEPSLVYNIIYGAIEYAEDLGFEPQKDFAISEYILDDVKEVQFIDVEFGKDGKPVYFTGPNDNVGRILRILEKNVGEGNFEYADGIPAHLLGDEEENPSSEEEKEDDGFTDFEEIK